MILLGFYPRTAASILALMLVSAAFASGFPFFFIRLPGAAGYPLTIVPSIELQLYVAFSFLAIALLGPGKFSIHP